MILSGKILTGFSIKAEDEQEGSIRDLLLRQEDLSVNYLWIEFGKWLNRKSVVMPTDCIDTVDLPSKKISALFTLEKLIEQKKDFMERCTASAERWMSFWPRVGDFPVGVSGFSFDGTPVTHFEPNLPPSAHQEDVVAPRPESPILLSFNELRHFTVQSVDDERADLTDILIDVSEWRAQALVVHSGNWLMGRDIMVSPHWVEKVSAVERRIYLNIDSRKIEMAPQFIAGEPVNIEGEHNYFDYYGRRRSANFQNYRGK